MNTSFSDTPSDHLFSEERMYTYLKTYASVKEMRQTLISLPLARKLHENQFRKGKDQVPYIYHPLLMSCQALSLGLDDDNLISAALLHDVCEDCNVSPEELPVNREIQEAVGLLTRNPSTCPSPEKDFKAYFHGISENKIASLVKLLDRCNNVSGMAAAFSRKKMQSYIQETQEYIYPLFSSVKTYYPEYSNQIFLLKYHMTSVVESLKHVLESSNV